MHASQNGVSLSRTLGSPNSAKQVGMQLNREEKSNAAAFYKIYPGIQQDHCCALLLIVADQELLSFNHIMIHLQQNGHLISRSWLWLC